MFEPYTQNVWPSLALMQVVLRTRAAPDSIIAAARQTIQDVDPAVPLANIVTLATLTSDAMAADRFSMLLIAFFGVTALLLAAIGLYGVMAYSAGQRSLEIGIRLALGAQRSAIVRMVLRDGLRLAFAGILLGVITALLSGRMLAGFLYGVSAHDPVTMASVALLIAVIALAASFIPARRAAGLDPIQTLRGE
jgi:putative ABC transport system permease protein